MLRSKFIYQYLRLIINGIYDTRLIKLICFLTSVRQDAVHIGQITCPYSDICQSNRNINIIVVGIKKVLVPDIILSVKYEVEDKKKRKCPVCNRNFIYVFLNIYNISQITYACPGNKMVSSYTRSSIVWPRTATRMIDSCIDLQLLPTQWAISRL